MHEMTRALRDLSLRLALLLVLAVTIIVAGPQISESAAPEQCPHHAQVMPHVAERGHTTGHMPDAACFQACLGAVIFASAPDPVLVPRLRCPSQEAAGDWALRSAFLAPVLRPPNPVFAETSVL